MKRRLNEYLDNKTTQVYNYLKDGERYSSEGYISSSYKLIPLFFEYVLSEMPDDEYKSFQKAVRSNNKLRERFLFSITPSSKRLIRCYSKMTDGLEEVPLTKYVKTNSRALFRIFDIEDANFVTIWDNFIHFINSEDGMLFMKKKKSVDANVVLMNPSVEKNQWLVHFTDNENNALDICKNGFKYGTSIDHLDNLGFTNTNVSKDEKKNGNFAYAYKALNITDGYFPSYTSVSKDNWEFDNMFDQKAWEHALHYLIMFEAPSVQAFHHTDKEYQVIFNTERAQNFVLLAFSWNSDKIPNGNDTRAHKGNLKGDLRWNVTSVNGDVVYSNGSLTKCIRWVADNFEQYRKQICWSHNVHENKIIYMTENQVNALINESLVKESKEDISQYQDVINQQLNEANEFLSQYGLSVVFNYNYDFTHFPYLAVYQNRSVKNGGRIRIGINLPLLSNEMKKRKINSNKIITQITISIWHEIGHGIIEWLKMLRRHDTQNKTKIFHGNMLSYFKNLMEDEEEVVEEFGAYWADWSMYSNLQDFLDDYEEEIKQAMSLKSLNGKPH